MNAIHTSKPTQTQDRWQVTFAFQVFHRSVEDWMKMRWGFNAAVLLDEAIDRQRLFVESQIVDEDTLLAGNEPQKTLALRGMNLPGLGLQMSLVGKVGAKDASIVEEEAQKYARTIHSTFPQDFVLRPAETKNEFESLSGASFFAKTPRIAMIQRALAPIPSPRGYERAVGLWQATTRSNEQIWRALAGTTSPAMFNITLQPSMMFEGDRELILELRKVGNPKEKESVLNAPYTAWADQYIKRRLTAWKKFFMVQVHVLCEGKMDEHLVRSIGSALTRDTADSPLPGYQIVKPTSPEDEKDWIQQIQALDLIPSFLRTDDLADMDEAASVFRFPYRPEAGLPGARFLEPPVTV
jgi:hypothetical protein